MKKEYIQPIATIENLMMESRMLAGSGEATEKTESWTERWRNNNETELNTGAAAGWGEPNGHNSGTPPTGGGVGAKGRSLWDDDEDDW